MNNWMLLGVLPLAYLVVALWLDARSDHGPASTVPRNELEAEIYRIKQSTLRTQEALGHAFSAPIRQMVKALEQFATAFARARND